MIEFSDELSQDNWYLILAAKVLVTCTIRWLSLANIPSQEVQVSNPHEMVLIESQLVE